MNYKIVTTNELYHHGIKGQKWGVRRFQNTDGSLKSAGKKRYSEDKPKEKKGLTEKQKKWIKRGAIAAGIAVAAIGTYALYKNGNLDPIIDKFVKNGENKTNDILGFTSKDAPKVTAENAVEFSKNINPSHSTSNCGSTSAAVLDNLLGGNSQALSEVPEHMRITLSDGSKGKGYDPKELIKCYQFKGKDAQWSDKITDNLGSRRKVSETLEKELLAQGEGAKGLFYCEGQVGNRPGHFFSYTILGNKVHVLEGQPPSAQASGLDLHNNFYEDVGKLFDLNDGNKSVFYSQIDHIKEDRRKDILQERN